MFLPFLVGFAILGHGFDRFKVDTSEYQIFDADDIERNIQITQNPSFQSRFMVPNSSREVNDFLNMDPEFSLLSKRGIVNIPGYSRYIKVDVDREVTVDILFSIRINTEMRTFPAQTKLRTEWQELGRDVAGTHYIKSIQYGGSFFGYYRATAKKEEYTEEVKAAVTKYIGKSGDIAQILPGNIDKLEEEIGEKVHQSVSTLGSVIQEFYPVVTLRSLWQLAVGFPKWMKKFEEEGSPVGMELEDLSTIQEKFQKFEKNPELKSLLYELDEKYDDVWVTHERFLDSELRKRDFTPEQNKMIDDFGERLGKIYNAMNRAISSMDVTGGVDQFDETLQLYGTAQGDNKYRKEFNALMKTILPVKQSVDSNH